MRFLDGKRGGASRTDSVSESGGASTACACGNEDAPCPNPGSSRRSTSDVFSLHACSSEYYVSFERKMPQQIRHPKILQYVPV